MTAGAFMTEYAILSLGAGVQSTTVYLMGVEGTLHLDHAVFADTGEEPKAVYRHLEWLESLGGPPIHRASKGRIGDDLMRGTNSTGQRFTSVPFFTMKPDGETGMTRRQCSKEYKVEVVERFIRRGILGLKPRQRVPKGVNVVQYFGISVDEARRTIGIRKRLGDRARFPLIDLDMTRADCARWLAGRVPHETPRSSCVFCPFHSDAEWMAIRSSPDREDWQRAIEIDGGLREAGRIVNRNMEAQMFAHRSCVPLDEVEFRHERQLNMFTLECEGACGV